MTHNFLTVFSFTKWSEKFDFQACPKSHKVDQKRQMKNIDIKSAKSKNLKMSLFYFSLHSLMPITVFLIV